MTTVEGAAPLCNVLFWQSQEYKTNLRYAVTLGSAGMTHTPFAKAIQWVKPDNRVEKFTSPTGRGGKGVDT